MRRKDLTTLALYGLAFIGLFTLLPALNGLTGLLVSVLIWAASGILAGRLLRGRGYSWLMNIGLGLVGGVVGALLFGFFGLDGIMRIPVIGQVMAGTVGAVVVIYLVRLFGNRHFGH